MNSYPERIYLQVEDNGDMLDNPSDWTHCADRVNDSDVEYVRGDVSAKARRVVDALLDGQRPRVIANRLRELAALVDDCDMDGDAWLSAVATVLEALEHE